MAKNKSTDLSKTSNSKNTDSGSSIGKNVIIRKGAESTKGLVRDSA